MPRLLLFGPVGDNRNPHTGGAVQAIIMEEAENMSKVWFVTGAGRGMGVDIAKAALAAGNKVVATGRNIGKVAEAVGESANLLIGKLDITKPADAESAVKAAVDKFGHIDVLVNNAANFYAGFLKSCRRNR
jgi:NAD(P)-dependent dehydrogenase (short-subunit alcohol dehydrogenase family)